MQFGKCQSIPRHISYGNNITNILNWYFKWNAYNKWNTIFSTMCFMNEIPEKEALKAKKMEKEKQQEDNSNHEEKLIMVNAAWNPNLSYNFLTNSSSHQK